VFAVAGHNGDVFCYRPLAQHVGDDQPFFGLQPPGLDGQSEPLTSIEDLAVYFAEQIRAFRPEGPYVIAGFCAGGTIAMELARQLLERGAEVSFVAMFACPYPTWYRFWPQLRYRIASLVKSVGKHARALVSMSFAERRRHIAALLRQWKDRRDAISLAAQDPVMVLRGKVEDVTLDAVRRHTPHVFLGRVSMFLPSPKWLHSSLQRWRPVAQHIDEYCGPVGCTGDRILLEPFASPIAELFRRAREKNLNP
jgi:thioesterase domain-containing protein